MLLTQEPTFVMVVTQEPTTKIKKKEKKKRKKKKNRCHSCISKSWNDLVLHTSIM